MELNHTYFYTATIKDWKHLLKEDEFKDIIISSLKYLTINEFMQIYGFVIMPNHIHIIWKLLKKNGKEMPHASFKKYTSHQFLLKLSAENQQLLSQFEVNTTTRKHLFWQRDALAIELYSDIVFEQKLDYIHNNPLQAKWELAETAASYNYSSAKFYETEIDDFGIITHCSDWV